MRKNPVVFHMEGKGNLPIPLVGARKHKPADPLAVLERVAHESARRNSVSELLQLLADNAAILAVASLGVVALYIPEERSFQLAAASDPGIPVDVKFASVQELQEWGARQFSKLNGNGDKPGVRAIDVKHLPYTLGASLTAQGESLGRVVVYAAQPFNNQVAGLLNVLTAQISYAIYSARLMDQVREQRESLERAGMIASAFQRLRAMTTQSVSKASLASELLDILHSVVPFQNAALYKRERATYFSVLGAFGNGQVLMTTDHLRAMGFHTLPLLQELIVSRKPFYAADVTRTLRWRPHLPDHSSGSWAGIPLLSGGMIVGLLSLGHDQIGFFTSSHQHLVEVFAAAFATLIHNVILMERKTGENRRLSALTQKIVTAQEEERKRVSRELHDEAGQSLTALTINLELLQQDMAGQSQALIDRARESVEITRQTLNSISLLAKQLRPPALDTMGLVGALEQLCKDVQRRTGLEIVMSAHQIKDIDSATSLTLYRFVQEALTNVTKHAEATHAEIRVEKLENEIRVSVHDNGKGFDHNQQVQGPRRAGRLGLLGMQERLTVINGHLEVHSVPGDGTLLIARVPLPTQPPVS